MADDVALVAHATKCDEIALWVGVRRAAVAPKLTFWRDEKEVEATPIRPMTATRTAPCSFTGIYRLGGLSPDTRYTVRVQTDTGASQTLRTRTLPDELRMGETFRILLASCYHRDEAPKTLRATLDGLFPWAARPNLVLLMGDQVYLDLPTEKSFPEGEAELAAIFEADYVANWFDAELTSPLRMAPVVCCPDDHEYWNNYPDRATIVQNTWTPEGRASWTSAATMMYRAFQLAPGRSVGDGVRIDVPPLSIFVLDTRSSRGPERSRLLAPAALKDLETWGRSLPETSVALLVTGQSLLSEPVSSLKGAFVDWEPANYGPDYATIVRIVSETAAKVRGFFLLTGDVHWGRITTVSDRHDWTLLHEIISSPTSLVTTFGVDGLKKATGRLTRWATGDTWPRHSDAPDPPTYFARSVLESSFRTKRIHKQQGDQVALLEITRQGFGCSARVTYYALTMPPEPSEAYELSFHRP